MTFSRAQCSSAKRLVCHPYESRRQPLELQSAGSRLLIDARLLSVFAVDATNPLRV